MIDQSPNAHVVLPGRGGRPYTTRGRVPSRLRVGTRTITNLDVDVIYEHFTLYESVFVSVVVRFDDLKTLVIGLWVLFVSRT